MPQLPTPVSRLNIVVVSAGLSSPSRTADLADAIAKRACQSLEAQRITARVTAVAVRDLLVGVAHKLATGVTEPDLRFALDALRESDGVVAVSPVFNGQIAGHFKAFFDLVDPMNLRGIPVALGATGGSPRHALTVEMNMRPLFAYLRAFPLPTGVYAAAQEPAEDVFARAATLGQELADAMLVLRTPTHPAATQSQAQREVTSLLATAYDYSEEGLRERDRREQHETFAQLLTQFGQEPWPKETRSPHNCADSS